jgi:hypothetical protein
VCVYCDVVVVDWPRRKADGEREKVCVCVCVRCDCCGVTANEIVSDREGVCVCARARCIVVVSDYRRRKAEERVCEASVLVLVLLLAAFWTDR